MSFHSAVRLLKAQFSLSRFLVIQLLKEEAFVE